MQLKQDASSRMQDQWNSSRRILCSSQSQFALRNLPLTKPMRNFALPKFAMSSQCQIRNAKISQCQIRNANFAMPISQCQIQFRNANFKFAMPIHCSFVSQSKPLRNFALRNSQEFRKPISHCQIHCLCEIHPAKFTGLVILCN